MPETPSQQIISAANRTVTVTDELGRVLTVKRFMVSERMRFLKSVPAELQTNPLWITNAMAIGSVVEIDGIPQPMPHNESSIEAAGDMLGDEGLFAAQQALEQLLGAEKTKREALKSLGEPSGTPPSASASGS